MVETQFAKATRVCTNRTLSGRSCRSIHCAVCRPLHISCTLMGTQHAATMKTTCSIKLGKQRGSRWPQLRARCRKHGHLFNSVWRKQMWRLRWCPANGKVTSLQAFKRCQCLLTTRKATYTSKCRHSSAIASGYSKVG